MSSLSHNCNTRIMCLSLGRLLAPTFEIVMLEKLDSILSKRAVRPIYMKVQVRLNAISPYQSQQSSPAIRDITVSGHTRHLRLRLRPVYAIPTVLQSKNSQGRKS